MTLQPLGPTTVFRPNSQTSLSFLETGDIFEFTSAGCLINSLQGNPKDGSPGNLWLRFYDEKGAVSATYPLLGIRSQSLPTFTDTAVFYQGQVEGVSYTVTFTWGEKEGTVGWIWHVELQGEGQSCDVVYGQDLGMGDKGGVLTNELYIAQYLGHSIFQDHQGFLVYSRQNQHCACGNPTLRQGMILGKALHYSTDGMQFFTTSYRATGFPAALSGDLPDRNVQYELSYTALQSERFVLQGKTSLAFYALFHPDHPAALTEPEPSALPQALLTAAQGLVPPARETASPLRLAEAIGPAYASPPWDDSTVESHWPQRHLEERQKEGLLSFFAPNHVHVALQQKELLCPRSHGMIHMTMPSLTKVSENLLATTSTMCGAFLSQVIVGNTNFHKAVSAVRSPLNLMTNSGVRLYVKLGNTYRLLTLPSAYETGIHFARWYYQLEEDVITCTVFTTHDLPGAILDCASAKGKTYDFILTAQLLFGEQEFTSPVVLEEEQGTLVLTGEKPGFVQEKNPDLCYRFHLPEQAQVHHDGLFFSDGRSRNGTLLTVTVAAPCFRFALEGCPTGASQEEALLAADFTREEEKYLASFSRCTAGLHLSLPQESQSQEAVEKLNETIWWYTHNALIHFASPHGLEQPGGAAWGTRDVCQGPMEYFLMTGNFTLAREILLRIFQNQQLHTGEWPQWFMFDGYPMNAGECHGDVVFWPLKALSDYLLRTQDHSILEEKLDYIGPKNTPAHQPEPLLAHLERAIRTVEDTRFVGDTKLVSYAGGDWDDTLQPADPTLKEHLISAWTVALSYQVFAQLSQALPENLPLKNRLASIAGEIARDFQEHLVGDGVIAGFALENQGKLEFMLHPADEKTGIHYRLLPQTRSIIAQLVDKAQAEQNMALIEEHLKCPDGVRLMDRPARYDGGVSHLFLRAEQAANVGREISLQYVHAHIRYIEACAKLGLAEEAWDAMLRVNPIKLKDLLPRALPRQSNLYFSSSEGDFADRMEYARDFHKLKSGDIDVKAGWRLYSSGPGIYLNQVVSHLLGITFTAQGLLLDPVLPQDLHGLQVQLNFLGTPLTLTYHLSSESGPLRVEKDGQPLSLAHLFSPENPYRPGPTFLPATLLTEDPQGCHLTVYR